MTRKLYATATVAAAALPIGSALLMAGPALAAPPTDNWGCTASAVRVTFAGTPPVEPLRAQPPTYCAPMTEGIDNLGPQVGNAIGADVLRASTAADVTKPVLAESPAAESTVTNLRVTNTGTPIIALPGTIAARVAATCVGGQPTFTSSYTTAPVVIGGQTIPTDKPVQQVITGISGATSPVLTIVPGEEVKSTTAGVTSDTIRGLHLNLHFGGAYSIDVVAAEATASYAGNPCANGAVPGSGGGSGGANSGSGSNGGGTSGGGSGSAGSGSGTSGSGSGSGAGGTGAGGTGTGTGTGSGPTSGSNKNGTTTTANGSVIVTDSALLRTLLRQGYDIHGMRVEATREWIHGKWTRVRVKCAPQMKKGCTATLVDYRMIHYIYPRVIGRRRVHLRPGQDIILPIRARRWTVNPYAILVRIA